MARYTATGNLDSTFGTGGFVATPVGSEGISVARAVGVQPDGKIVVAGYAQDGGAYRFAVVRYWP